MNTDWKLRLAAYDDRQLDPRERAQLDQLLDESAEARDYLAALRHDRQRLREAFATVTARPGFAAGVMARLPRTRALRPMPRVMEVCAAVLMGLVVYSVIGPSPGAARAKQNTCQQNARLLTQAMLSYSTDYDGRLPSATRWPAQVASYTNAPGAFICPEDQQSGPVSYGMPVGLSFAELGESPHTGRDILIYDAAGLLLDPRHDRRRAAVAAYTDGSVELIRVDGR